MTAFELIESGDEDGLREALERDPALAAERDGRGLSPVLAALYAGRAELVQPILDANPPLDVFDAAAVGRTRGLEELLEAEPSLVGARSPDAFTALHLAASFGQAAAVRLLLEHGADANARGAAGFTPLHAAARSDDRESSEALLAAGADPTLRTDDGRTAADLAGERTRELVAVSN